MPTVGKSTTDILYGKCRWAKLFSPSKFNKWSLELNLDQDSVAKALELKKKGIRNQIKKDDDGYWMTCSRNCVLEFMGQKKPNTPVIVLNEKGEPWNPDTHIGNGSEVACKINVREYKIPGSIDGKGVAIRLESVKVLNLVPWSANKDFEEDERIKAEGLIDVKRKEEW